VVEQALHRWSVEQISAVFQPDQESLFFLNEKETQIELGSGMLHLNWAPSKFWQLQPWKRKVL
jgi:hypothetical protein